MSLFDIDIKQDGDKVVFDFTNETSRLMRGFHANLERLCKEDFDRFAAANGYVKLQPGQIVVDTKVWLPYLVKAINAAKILQNHGAFTVKHYHGDWPSLEMLQGLLSTAIDRQTKDNTNA